MIRLTRRTADYAWAALSVLKTYKAQSFEEWLRITALQEKLAHYLPLVEKVIDQAYRRVVEKEKVPVQDKCVSIFEPHTDIIAKGGREVIFGHKLCLTQGKSKLILACDILAGNPADKTLAQPILKEHKDFYRESMNQFVLDGGFSSKANATFLKKEGIKELTFSKNPGLKLEDLVSSHKVHKKLMHFRAGIEGCISLLKRAFGLGRILTRGLEGFKATVQCAVVTHNLVLLAGLSLKPS